MKIALLYLTKGGGIANCTYELASVLSRSHDVTCYVSSENELLPRFRTLACETRAFAWRRGKFNLLMALLARRDTTGIAKEILKDKPDLVIDTGSWWWRGVVFTGLKGRVPIAEIVHDPTPHPGRLQFFFKLHHRLFPSRADIVIALSAFAYREMVQKYPSKHHVSSKHGIIIPSGEVDAGSVASRRMKMLFFGLIEPYKGIDVLVDAYNIARASSPEIELTIAGKGMIEPELLKKIRASGIKLINEYIPESDVAGLLADHGLMILPYTYATQSGVAAVALANGLPCIATSVGALPEQIQNGTNGIIVPPGDARELAAAMVRVAGDFDLARAMSEASYKIGREEYSWDKIAGDLVAALERILAAM